MSFSQGLPHGPSEQTHACFARNESAEQTLAAMASSINLVANITCNIFPIRPASYRKQSVSVSKKSTAPRTTKCLAGEPDTPVQVQQVRHRCAGAAQIPPGISQNRANPVGKSRLLNMTVGRTVGMDFTLGVVQHNANAHSRSTLGSVNTFDSFSGSIGMTRRGKINAGGTVIGNHIDGCRFLHSD
jgi:hypothetical protein